MFDDRPQLSGWITFAGCVLVIAVLYWAQAVLVPVCLAVLLTFVLTPPVVWLQRRIGKVAAVLCVVVLVFTFLGLAGWGVVRQMSHLSVDVHKYRTNIQAKLTDLRGVRQGDSVSKFERAIRELQGDFSGAEPLPGSPSKPLVVTSDHGTAPVAAGWMGPLVGPFGQVLFIVTLVMYMLLEREHLRDRVLRLVGHGHLAATTKALDEAGQRVSQQLLLQTVVNLIYGSIAAAGLWAFGVPYPLFWGAAGAVLRFIPYLGPISAAAGPVLIAFAALPGWTRPLEVAAFYGALELFTNMVLETILYAGAMGVSQVALMVSVAFWTWLWGPLGLLMATPLTVCLVVIGKHVPGLNFLGTLLSDAPALTPENSYYQRLLARDQAEAIEIVERFVKTETLNAVFDAMLIPALNFAERDRIEGRLSREEEMAVIDTTRDVLDVLASDPGPAAGPFATPARILAYPANGAGDELALRMLAQFMSDVPVRIDISTTRVLAAELLEQVRSQGYAAICIADLPPSPSSKTRYLVKRLRAANPDLRIIVGRWAHATLTDESVQPLLDAGATQVARSLTEARKYLAETALVDGTEVVAPIAAA